MKAKFLSCKIEIQFMSNPKEWIYQVRLSGKDFTVTNRGSAESSDKALAGAVAMIREYKRKEV